MPRCPIVVPAVDRLYFADTYRRAHQALEAQVAARKKVKPEVLEASRAALAAAEADGDWLDVKRTLNTGEYRAMITGQYREVEDHYRVDLDRMGMNRVLAYVVGWSFVDTDGKPLPFSEAAIKNCDIEAFKDALDAVDAHHEAREAEAVIRKNARAGEKPSSATLPSVA